jgi:hypothetical protein
VANPRQLIEISVKTPRGVGFSPSEGAFVTGQPLSGGAARFAGDDYERLRQAAVIAAADPAIADAPSPLDATGLMECVDRVAAERAFDELTRREADWVSMALLLDFCDGPGALVARLEDLLNARDERTVVVAGALAAVLRIVLTHPCRGWAAEDR